MRSNTAQRPRASGSPSGATVTPLRAKHPPRARRRAPWRPVVGLAALVLLVAAAVAWRDARVRPVAARACETAIVTHGSVSGLLRARGRLTTESEIRIGSPGPGRIVAVKVRPGDRVKKGQILALLDDVEQKAGVVAAGAQVTTAELGGLRAERELGQILESLRRQGLLPETLSPDDLLEGAAGDAQLDLLHTTAQAAKQHAALQLARTLLARRTIRAPASGVVLSRSIEPGESIPASPPGPPLFAIGSDPGTLRLQVEIDERYVGGVRPGQATFTTPAHGGYAFTASIDKVVPLEGAVRSPAPYLVLLTVPNADGALAPGATAVVELPVGTSREAVHVPLDALRSLPGAASVLWLPDDDGRPVATPVEVGVTDGRLAEVQGPGVAAGRVVVTDDAPPSCLVRVPPSPFGGGLP